MRGALGWTSQRMAGPLRFLNSCSVRCLSRKCFEMAQRVLRSGQRTLQSRAHRLFRPGAIRLKLS